MTVKDYEKRAKMYIIILSKYREIDEIIKAIEKRRLSDEWNIEIKEILDFQTVLIIETY